MYGDTGAKQRLLKADTLLADNLSRSFICSVSANSEVVVVTLFLKLPQTRLF